MPLAPTQRLEPPMPISYYVYEDDPTQRARVHTSACVYVINRASDRLPDNRWLEFEALEAAMNRANQKQDAAPCPDCLP